MEKVKKMATKSILKVVHIRDKKSALRLVNALENASVKEAKQVTFRRPVHEVKAEQLRTMFGINDNVGL
jgi:hypothetical protein